MSGIVFFNTRDLEALRSFYLDSLGLNLWLDQGKCLIFEHNGFLVGFCIGESSQSQGTITFLYDSKKLVDTAYERYKSISTSAPCVNSSFRIYHFWGADPEGRILEFQYFMKASEIQEDNSGIVEILNPDASKPKLLLTRLLPQKAMEKLKEAFEVHANTSERAMLAHEMKEHITGKDALVCLLSDTIDRSLIEATDKLKVIANYAVGYNNIDLEAAKARGIAVCNTPGVLTESTADLAWALIMASARCIPQSDKYTREGKFVGWEPLLFLGKDVHHKTLGILGMGRIGQAVARRAVGFGMKVIYHGPQIKELNIPAQYVDFETLLRESDILSLHLPLSSVTRHLIGEKELKAMKPGAILINTARGAIVDEKILIKALSEGWIWAAGLDVYEDEPEIPADLKRLSNVVILPHIGSASMETREEMGMMAARNAIAVIQGKEAPARVV
jgi:glyoxylate reductase